MASLWQETMEGTDQAHLVGLHAQAEGQEAMYMMWEEMDQYQQFRHALVGANPSVPSYTPQYMAPIFPEATTASVPYMGTDGSVWAGDAAPAVDMTQWLYEDGGGGVDLVQWCSDSQRVACYDQDLHLSHSRGTSSTESLPAAGGSEWGAETPELPTPPALDHWRLPPTGPAPFVEPAASDPIVPGGCSAQYVIKNTFIETEAESDNEVETFFRKRRACSCPSSPAGRWGDDSFDIVLEAAQRLKKWKAVDAVGSDHTPVVAQASMRWADHAVGTATPDAPAERLPPSVHVLRLADVLGEPEPVAPAELPGELPSIGSAGHASGACKPCAFAHTKGCWTGEDCKFCHLCQPGCARRRKKDLRTSPVATSTRSGRRSTGSRAA